MTPLFWWRKRFVLVVSTFAFLCATSLAARTPAINTEWKKEGFLPSNHVELLKLRQEYVQAIQHLDIYPKNYQPSTALFKRIKHDRPWVSQNGFLISNPQLLILVSRPRRILPLDYIALEGNPDNERDIFHVDKKTIVLYYGSSANIWIDLALKNGIRLWGANARDAGFNYVMLDLAQSRNIDETQTGNIMREPIPINEYFYYAYRAKRNNLGPAYPAIRIKLKDRQPRTKLHIKLWHEKPAQSNMPADYTHTIEVLLDPAGTW